MDDRAQGTEEGDAGRRAPPERGVRRRRRAWVLAASAVVLLGALGAVVNGRVQAPLYRAVGMIHVAPAVPTLQDPAGLDALPRFEGYMNYQVGILQQPRMVRLALETEAWRKTGQGTGPEALEAFEENREILYERGAEHIQVAFTDPRPDVAVAGLHALLDAYEQLAKELNSADERLEFARGEAERLASELKLVDDQVAARTAEHSGPDGLVSDLEEVTRRLRVAETELEATRQAVRERETAGEAGAPRHPATPHEIALQCATMGQALLDRAGLEAEEQGAAQRVGEKDSALADVRRRIAALDRLIEALTEAWNRTRESARAGEVSLEALRATERAGTSRVEPLRVRLLELRRLQQEVERLQSKEQDLARRLRLAQALTEQLTAEVVGKGRISIADRGALPTTPWRGGRFVPSLRGAVLGGLGGPLLLLLVRLLAPRLRRRRPAPA